MSEKASLFVIAAPSGAGKTSLIAAAVEQMDNIQISVSHTTRSPRPDDREGRDYFFISKALFEQMIQEDRFLEHATVFGQLYGTSKDWAKEQLRQGIDVIFELDWQGARSIKSLFPQAITVFILPPSLEALKKRLIGRDQDRREVIQQRMEGAKETISHYSEFDYVIVNDDFDRSLQRLIHIILAARQRQAVQALQHQDLLAELLQ